MFKRIFLLLIVLIVLIIQFVQRGWFLMTQLFIEKVSAQLIIILEEPQFQALWREIVYGRQMPVIFYLAAILSGIVLKVLVTKLNKRFICSSQSF